MAGDMQPSAEKQEWLDQAEHWCGSTIKGEAIKILAEDFGDCFDAGAVTERAKILALLWEAAFTEGNIYMKAKIRALAGEIEKLPCP